MNLFVTFLAWLPISFDKISKRPGISLWISSSVFLDNEKEIAQEKKIGPKVVKIVVSYAF